MTLSTSSSDTSGRIINITSYLRIRPPIASVVSLFGRAGAHPEVCVLPVIPFADLEVCASLAAAPPREPLLTLQRRRLPLVVAVHRLLQTFLHYNRDRPSGAVNHVR